MQEEFIICGRCGWDVSKTKYCIYCWLPLSEQDKKLKTRFAERKSGGEGVDLFRPEQVPDIPEPKFFSFRTAMKQGQRPFECRKWISIPIPSSSSGN